MVAVDAVDDWLLLLLLLPDAEVLALLVDEFHGVVEAPVAHGDRPHGAGLEDDSKLGVGLTVGGKCQTYDITINTTHILNFRSDRDQFRLVVATLHFSLHFDNFAQFLSGAQH